MPELLADRTQVHASKAAADEGEVAYPGLSPPPAAASKKGGSGGGQLRAEDLPTAPPLPGKQAASERQREPAMRA